MPSGQKNGFRYLSARSAGKSMRELFEALLCFRAAVRAGGAEVLVVELDGVTVLPRVAVELDAEIDREPAVRDVREHEPVAARVEDMLGVGLAVLGDEFRTGAGEVVHAGDAP
jgi:hypothetical protein